MITFLSTFQVTLACNRPTDTIQNAHHLQSAVLYYTTPKYLQEIVSSDVQGGGLILKVPHTKMVYRDNFVASEALLRST